MPHTFTRQELYDLVWSEPMRTLAGKYGISDRGLAKACAAGNVPVPERGYWNKLQAGHKVSKTPLPSRALGQTDEVTIGRTSYYYGDTEKNVLNKPIPPPPVFDEDMESVRAKVTRMVNKAPLPTKYAERPHHQIARLQAADEERRQKQEASAYPSSSDAPVFDTPFERRRLDILNGLFMCLGFCGFQPSVSGKEGRDLSVIVGDMHVSFSLDAAGAEKQIERERMEYGFQSRDPKAKMRLAIGNGRPREANDRSWQDAQGDRVEKHMREIAIELIVAGEQSYRDGLIHHREWLIRYKAELEERERQRKLEEERKRKEHQAKLEKQRIDHLLGQADALHRAAQIRAYVAAIHEANRTAPDPMSAEELNSWTPALAQADRIDPVVNGSYKTRPPEPEE